MDPKDRNLVQDISSRPVLLKNLLQRGERQEDFAAVFPGYVVAVGGDVDAEPVFHVALVRRCGPGSVCERGVGGDGAGWGDGVWGG